jgi:hypothetical protein
MTYIMSELEYNVSCLANGELNATLDMLAKAEASMDDYEYVLFNNDSDLISKQQYSPTGSVRYTYGGGGSPTESMGYRPSSLPGQRRMRQFAQTTGQEINPETGKYHIPAGSGGEYQVAPGMGQRAKQFLGRAGAAAGKVAGAVGGAIAAAPGALIDAEARGRGFREQRRREGMDERDRRDIARGGFRGRRAQARQNVLNPAAPPAPEEPLAPAAGEPTQQSDIPAAMGTPEPGVPGTEVPEGAPPSDGTGGSAQEEAEEIQQVEEAKQELAQNPAGFSLSKYPALETAVKGIYSTYGASGAGSKSKVAHKFIDEFLPRAIEMMANDPNTDIEALKNLGKEMGAQRFNKERLALLNAILQHANASPADKAGAALEASKEGGAPAGGAPAGDDDFDFEEEKAGAPQTAGEAAKETSLSRQIKNTLGGKAVKEMNKQLAAEMRAEGKAPNGPEWETRQQEMFQAKIDDLAAQGIAPAPAPKTVKVAPKRGGKEVEGDDFDFEGFGSDDIVASFDNPLDVAWDALSFRKDHQ